MSTIFSNPKFQQEQTSATLAASITKASSKQTYYTIQFLADRDLVQDAYRAYAYFRWLDDILDVETTPRLQKISFVERQQSLMENCYLGNIPAQISPEEQILVDLIHNDHEKNSGLQSYLRNMMAVMVFDVERCGRTLSRSELAQYSHFLSTAVTEALHYFIGHNDPSPKGETRTLAVQGAHVVHMLRDTREDSAAGYINIPSEYLEAHRLSYLDLDSPAFREWVYSRVQAAHLYFKIGRETIAGVKNLRCRLAGFAYLARFEWLLRAIEMDGYRLRADYSERKSMHAGLWMLWQTFTSTLAFPGARLPASRLSVQLQRNKRA